MREKKILFRRYLFFVVIVFDDVSKNVMLVLIMLIDSNDISLCRES